MSVKKYLKQLIKYEKDLKGPKYALQLLILSFISCLVVSKYNNIKEELLSNKNMNSIIANDLDNNILDIDIYNDQFSTSLIALGEVIENYMTEYNIDIIIIGNEYITKEGNDIKKISYVDANKNVKESYYLEEQEVIESNIIKEEIIKTLSISNIAKYYNLSLIDNNFPLLKKDSNSKQKIALLPKTD